MLPDFPEIKRYLRKTFLLTIEKEMRKNGLLSQIAVHETHEGNAFKLTSAEGFLQEGKYKELSSKFEIPREEMISKGPEAYLDKAVQIAKDISGEREKQIFEKMDEVTKMTRNIVNAESKPLSPDLILSALDKIAIDFDELARAR
jgi:hypothetical protein